MSDKRKRIIWIPAILVVLLLGWSTGAGAAIQGVSGTTFNLEAKPDYIVTSDGDSFLMWGYCIAGSRMQYPGPTLIVNQGDLITINLTNQLTIPTSMVFPGHQVIAAGGVQGLLTREAPAGGGSVTYTFVAGEPGTYLYWSGTRPDLQVEMGLVGALIVRPTMGPSYAYNHADTAFDQEYLYLVTDMDPVIHRYVESGQWNKIDMSTYFPTNWFVNGRNFPDLMADNFVPWLPTQPYNCQPRMHPGERTLIRLIGAGVDFHPMHLHGNDFESIAADARVLTSDTANGGTNGPDLAWKATTIRTRPGGTADVLWTWTGEELGWDIYGHDPGVGYPRSDINPAWPGHICDQYVPSNAATYFDPYTNEYCPDHGVPFPVVIPPRDSLTFGQFYSGSPFLGGAGDLPVGHPALNAAGGFFYMWHSHTEKELTSNDIWPGGLVTFMIIEHPAVPIP